MVGMCQPWIAGRSLAPCSALAVAVSVRGWVCGGVVLGQGRKAAPRCGSFRVGKPQPSPHNLPCSCPGPAAAASGSKPSSPSRRCWRCRACASWTCGPSSWRMAGARLPLVPPRPLLLAVMGLLLVVVGGRGAHGCPRLPALTCGQPCSRLWPARCSRRALRLPLCTAPFTSPPANLRSRPLQVLEPRKVRHDAERGGPGASPAPAKQGGACAV